MTASRKMLVYFHEKQLLFAPPMEWDQRGLVPHPETPERARIILAALAEAPDEFEIRTPDEIPLAAIEAVHTPGMVRMLHAAESLADGVIHHITLFPKADPAKADPDNVHHAGFFCFDTSTPLGRDTWTSAAWSAASAVAGAKAIQSGETPAAYALCRPPGHHAARAYFGGYCYLNNAAIAATFLKASGRVAIVDIDFHHGDGTQAIFDEDPEVFTVSLHADTRCHYPYFSGLEGETGHGAGAGADLNVPLQAGATGDDMLAALTQQVIPALAAFRPKHLVIALGLDTYANDPLGDFKVQTPEYAQLGECLGALPYPVLIVQEGGYQTGELGLNARSFLQGIRKAKFA